MAKDDLKEALGGVLGTTGRADSKRLGAAVFTLMGVLARELLASGTSLIVEGNFSSAGVFAGLPEARVVQVHVSARPDVLRARMLDRDTHRHPVHYDREAADEVAMRATAGEWNPIALEGELLRIDTTTWPDLDVVLGSI